MLRFLDWILWGVDEAIIGFLSGIFALVLTVFILGLIGAAMVGQGGRFFGWCVGVVAKLCSLVVKALFALVGRGAEKATFEIVDLPGRRKRTDDPDEARLPREERDPCAEPEPSDKAEPSHEETEPSEQAEPEATEASGEAEPSQEAEPSAESGPASYHGWWRILGEDYEVVHVLCVGEPGSAKGQTILLPTLRHQLKHSEENIVFCTPKIKDKDLLRPYLREEDRVFEFSFCEDDPQSEAINPLYNLKAVTNAASFLIPEQGGNSTHFDQGGQSIFIAGWETLREELEVEAPNLVQVYDLMNDPERLRELRKRYPRMNAVSETDEKFEAFRQTAQKALQQLSTEEVRRVFNATDKTRRMDFSGASGRTIVLASLDGSPSAVEKLKKFVSLFVEHIYQQSSNDGYYKNGPGTKILIDEAGSCMQLTNMPQYINLSREYRVQILYVLQNMTQFEGQLGHNKAKECFISTKMKVIGAIDDKATAELVSERSGVERVTHRQPRQRNWYRHVAEERRYKLNPEHVYAQTEGEWIILKTPLVELVKVPKESYFWRRTKGEHDGGNVEEPDPGPDGGNGEDEPGDGEPSESPEGQDSSGPPEQNEGGSEGLGESSEGSEPEDREREPQSDCSGSVEAVQDGSETNGQPEEPARSLRERLADLDGYKEPPKKDSSGQSDGGRKESPEQAQQEEQEEPVQQPQKQTGGEKVECWNCEQSNPADAVECEVCGEKLPGANSKANGDRLEGRDGDSGDRTEQERR